jgi:hypothetical protein
MSHFIQYTHPEVIRMQKNKIFFMHTLKRWNTLREMAGDDEFPAGQSSSDARTMLCDHSEEGTVGEWESPSSWQDWF